MKFRTFLHFKICLLALICLVVVGKAQTSELQLTDLIKVCEDKISAPNFPKDTAKSRSEELTKIKSNLNKNRPWFSLSQLQNTWLETFMGEYLVSTASIEKSGKEAFEAEWKRVGVELNEKETQIDATNLKKKPLVLQAFAESFWSQIRTYYKSGYLFGVQQNPAEGLPYFGLSLASVKFLLSTQKLNLPNAKTPLPLRPLATEISLLEKRTLLIYRQTETNAEGVNPQQARFNIVNSLLKNAGELNRESRYAGAVYKYLTAVFYLEFIVSEPILAGDLPKLLAEIQTIKNQLEKSSKIDHSLGQYYLETAQSYLESSDKPAADDLKRVAAIVRKVMPEYFKYFTRGKK